MTKNYQKSNKVTGSQFQLFQAQQVLVKKDIMYLFKHLNKYEKKIICIFIELNTKFPYTGSLGP